MLVQPISRVHGWSKPSDSGTSARTAATCDPRAKAIGATGLALRASTLVPAMLIAAPSTASR
ncbi:MAG: hypothetical protein GDA49_11575 [Rhodospirillales bacterium]|nr:hypothetical protein [Rhodospirillales bacterium]